jgi:hypothetical protein
MMNTRNDREEMKLVDERMKMQRGKGKWNNVSKN